MTIADTIREEAVNLARPKIIEEERAKIIEEERAKIIEAERAKIIETERPKILAAGLVSMLRHGWPHLLPKYESALAKVKTQAGYDKLSVRVIKDIAH